MRFRFQNQSVLAALGVLSFASLSGLACAQGTVNNAAAPAPGTAPAPATPTRGAPHPNILLILADDLGWSDIGCYGGEIKTPNIDALAGEGLRFTQFYNSARCCPSRAALLTGLQPHQAGFPDMSGTLSKNAVTLPEVLDSAGYSTSMVGKWHLNERNTPVDRGFQDYYGMLGGFGTYFGQQLYTRLPADRPARQYKPGEFYSTDAFADYSIDFIRQAQQTPGKPWFQYLAFNAPHFPLMAPEDVVKQYEPVYAQGWDKIREARLVRQKQLGLVPKDLPLTPRSHIPPNFINTQTGWADKDNPAWDSLPANRRADLTRRMAIYAACVDKMDGAIGRVVSYLKQTKQYDNTLIFFLSDNGACAEWDPWGFDKIDSTLNILHTDHDTPRAGGPETYISYGSGWANASNTPWRLYKHYAQEGGIRTPLIVHWPQGLKTKAGSLTTQPGFITDFMPTMVAAAGATYPTEHDGLSIIPEQGEDLMPILNAGQQGPRTICMEHEGNRMVREGAWKLVALSDKPWELYNLNTDPAEMKDLSAQQTDRVQKMDADWEAWAQRSNVRPKANSAPSPQLAGKTITITCTVDSPTHQGVVLAQGGDMRGYALYFEDGNLVFGVRQSGTLYKATASKLPTGALKVVAKLASDGALTLAVGGHTVGTGKAPGVFTVQPKDELSIGEDSLSAVGDYKAPNALKGTVKDAKVVTK